MTAECAVCYVSDLNFLLPSLISAVSLRRFIPPHKADIFIFTVNVEAARVGEINQSLTQQHINVLSIEERVFSHIDQKELTKTHTPLATFGRFFMEDMLPASYRRIVYLDGDMWIAQDPTSLIEAIVPEGRFAAAEDTIFFRQNFGFGSTAREIRQYFKTLGLDPRNGYFNAGMFAVSRDTWKVISQEAYSFFLKNRESCKHFDQSALNAVVGDRRLRLSSKWNFQTQFRFWGVERFLTPCIYHFNRFPKPWMGPCDPWKEMYAKYESHAALFAGLNLPLRKLDARQLKECNDTVARSYSYLKWPLVSRIALRLMGYNGVEKTAWM